VALRGFGGSVCQYCLNFAHVSSDPSGFMAALTTLAEQPEKLEEALLQLCSCGFMKIYRLPDRHFFALKIKNQAGLVRTQSSQSPPPLAVACAPCTGLLDAHALLACLLCARSACRVFNV
jgi:hypothetical protein